MTGDDGIHLVGHAVEERERGEVVLDRMLGPQVEERHQGVREHVARDEDAAILDQQRRVPRGVGSVLDDPHGGSVPRNLASRRRAAR